MNNNLLHFINILSTFPNALTLTRLKGLKTTVILHAEQSAYAMEVVDNLNVNIQNKDEIFVEYCILNKL